MKSLFAFLGLLLQVQFSYVSAAPPVPYVGKLSLDGKNINGTVKFSFSIVDSAGSEVWAHTESNSLIENVVSNGRYVVLLGGQGMRPLPADIFVDNEELYVRVHVDLGDGNGLRHLKPDQRITSNPYAHVADVARKVLPGGISDDMLSEKLKRYAEATYKPRVTKPLTEISAIDGKNIELVAPIDGQFLTYTWYKDGRLLRDEKGRALNFNYFSSHEDVGNYEVVAANDWGHVSATFKVSSNLNTKDFSASYSGSSVFVVNDDGRLFAMGRNYKGQFGFKGDSTYTTHNDFIDLNISDVVMVSAFTNDLAFLKKDNSLWVSGYSATKFGADSNGSLLQEIHPPYLLDSDVIDIANGSTLLCYIKKDGSLWATGRPSASQIDSLHPYVIDSNNVQKISCGFSHIVYSHANGSIWGWGDNRYNQLTDDNSTEFYHTPIPLSEGIVSDFSANHNTSYFLKNNGSISARGNDYNASTMIVSSTAVKFFATSSNLFYEDESGRLFVLGDNRFGSAGIDNNFSSISTPMEIENFEPVALQGGLNSTLFKRSDGSIWGLGRVNPYALDENNESLCHIVPIKIWPKETITDSKKGWAKLWNEEEESWPYILDRDLKNNEFYVLDDYTLSRVGDSGTIVWQKEASAWNYDNVFDYIEPIYGIDDEENVYLAHNGSSVTKIGKDGQSLHTKNFNHLGSIRDLELLNEGILLKSGSIGSFGSLFSFYNFSYELLWEKTFPTAFYDHLVACADGKSVFLISYARSAPSLSIKKINELGDILWEKNHEFLKIDDDVSAYSYSLLGRTPIPRPQGGCALILKYRKGLNNWNNSMLLDFDSFGNLNLALQNPTQLAASWEFTTFTNSLEGGFLLLEDDGSPEYLTKLDHMGKEISRLIAPWEDEPEIENVLSSLSYSTEGGILLLQSDGGVVFSCKGDGAGIVKFYPKTP